MDKKQSLRNIELTECVVFGYLQIDAVTIDHHGGTFKSIKSENTRGRKTKEEKTDATYRNALFGIIAKHTV